MTVTLDLKTLEFATGLMLGILSGFSMGYFVYLHKEDDDNE